MDFEQRCDDVRSSGGRSANDGDKHPDAAGESSPKKPPLGRVLIIDDDMLVRSVAESILEDANYTVVGAEDGESGVEYYGSHGNDIDLVILDYIMPGIDGVETLRRLREIDPSVRVLSSSGHCAKEDVAAFISQGARAFLQKPYSRNDLIRTVKRILEPEDR